MKRKKFEFQFSEPWQLYALIVKQNKTGKVHKEKQRAQKAKFLWPCSFWLNFSIFLFMLKRTKKGQRSGGKNRKLSVWFFNFQVCDIFDIRKNIQKNQKLPGHFWKPKKFQEGDCFELAGFFPSSRCAWRCTCQSINNLWEYKEISTSEDRILQYKGGVSENFWNSC